MNDLDTMRRAGAAAWVRTCLAALPLAFLGACHQADEFPPRLSRSDSSGVLIAENRLPPASDPSWSLVPIAGIVLGAGEEAGKDGPVLFERVIDVTVSPGGRILVADEGPQRVYAFGPGGDLLASWGGRGGGPAEFQAISAVAACGDTLVAVLDRAALVLFDAAGGLSDRRPLDFTTVRITPAAVTPDCARVLGFRRISDPPAGSVGVPTYQFYWLDPAQHRVDTLTTTGLMESWTRTLYGETRAFPVPWGATLYTFDVTDDGVVIGDPRAPQLSLFSGGGVLRGIVRWDRRGASVSAEDVRRYGAVRERWRAGRPHDPEIDYLFPELSEYPRVPASKPVFDRVVVDADGRLWVRGFPEESLGILDQRLGPPPAAGGLAWTVFDASGAWLGDVRLPPGFELHAAAGDALYGVLTDSLGVQTVRAFRTTPR